MSTDIMIDQNFLVSVCNIILIYCEKQKYLVLSTFWLAYVKASVVIWAPASDLVLVLHYNVAEFSYFVSLYITMCQK